MYDLAMSLTNDTTMIKADVHDIYEFEKTISSVIYFILLFPKTFPNFLLCIYIL